MEHRVLTTHLVKAARALLGWSQADLAAKARISEPTVARLEAATGELRGRPDTVGRLRDALEAAGVEFIDEGGGGVGVRIRKPASTKRR
jgi:transcriptional regulator with XRE-family HTH domain